MKLGTLAEASMYGVTSSLTVLSVLGGDRDHTKVLAQGHSPVELGRAPVLDWARLVQSTLQIRVSERG